MKTVDFNRWADNNPGKDVVADLDARCTGRGGPLRCHNPVTTLMMVLREGHLPNDRHGAYCDEHRHAGEVLIQMQEQILSQGDADALEAEEALDGGRLHLLPCTCSYTMDDDARCGMPSTLVSVIAHADRNRITIVAACDDHADSMKKEGRI